MNKLVLIVCITAATILFQNCTSDNSSGSANEAAATGPGVLKLVGSYSSASFDVQPRGSGGVIVGKYLVVTANDQKRLDFLEILNMNSGPLASLSIPSNSGFNFLAESLVEPDSRFFILTDSDLFKVTISDLFVPQMETRSYGESLDAGIDFGPEFRKGTNFAINVIRGSNVHVTDTSGVQTLTTITLDGYDPYGASIVNDGANLVVIFQRASDDQYVLVKYDMSSPKTPKIIDTLELGSFTAGFSSFSKKALYFAVGSRIIVIGVDGSELSVVRELNLPQPADSMVLRRDVYLVVHTGRTVSVYLAWEP
ncbi:MAG: hypothetical protein AB7G93_18800 [Bdellovibrionales bacterium]